MRSPIGSIVSWNARFGNRIKMVSIEELCRRQSDFQLELRWRQVSHRSAVSVWKRRIWKRAGSVVSWLCVFRSRPLSILPLRLQIHSTNLHFNYYIHLKSEIYINNRNVCTTCSIHCILNFEWRIGRINPFLLPGLPTCPLGASWCDFRVMRIHYTASKWISTCTCWWRNWRFKLDCYFFNNFIRLVPFFRNVNKRQTHNFTTTYQ